MTDPLTQHWRQSADAWIAHVQAGNALRRDILDPALENWIRPLAPARVLDVGCGEGRLVRMMKSWGVDACGLDPVEPLLEQARIEDPQGDYRLGFAEELPYDDEEFDIVTSCLVLLDLPELAGPIREMKRVLKPGGRLIAATLCPHWTANAAGWRQGEDGSYLEYPLDWYGLDHAVRLEWAGIRIINHHWPQSSLLTAFLDQELRLSRFEEPLPPTDRLERNPVLWSCVRVPPAQMMEWRKD